MELKENYVLKNVNLIDGYGKEIKETMFVAVSGRHIMQIDDMSEYKADNVFQEIELAGHYVMPGLIDAHIHLSGGRGEGLYLDGDIISEPNLMRGMRSVGDAQTLLKSGITSCRDISWNGLYLKRIFREERIVGPRIIACGPGLARTGGHCDTFQFSEEMVQKRHQWAVLADGPEECRKWVRRILRQGADQIKFWASGGGNWATDNVFDVHYTFEEMKMICDEAHKISGTMVCAHAENLESIKQCIKAGVDTIEHGEMLDEECMELMIERGIILVPTINLLTNASGSFDLGSEEEKPIRTFAFHQRSDGGPETSLYSDEELEMYTNMIIDNFSKAKEKGVKIAMGSDTVYEPVTPYGEYTMQEYKALKHIGMTVSEIITSATLNSAKALGMDHKTGTLEVGKLADILVLIKNPAEDIEILCDNSNIRYVIQNGKVVVEEGCLKY